MRTRSLGVSLVVVKTSLKNIINKSIKNNIVPINNDGGVKSKRKHRGFIPSTFGVTVTCIKFSIYLFLIVIYIFIYALFYSLFLIVNYISSIIVAYIVFISSIFIFYLVVPHSLIRILIQISNISPINISFSSSFISFIYISFISFIIFTSFTGLFISDNTVITI